MKSDYCCADCGKRKPMHTRSGLAAKGKGGTRYTCQACADSFEARLASRVKAKRPALTEQEKRSIEIHLTRHDR